jgi:hypothetical protein
MAAGDIDPGLGMVPRFTGLEGGLMISRHNRRFDVTAALRSGLFR